MVSWTAPPAPFAVPPTVSVAPLAVLPAVSPAPLTMRGFLVGVSRKGNIMDSREGKGWHTSVASCVSDAWVVGSVECFTIGIGQNKLATNCLSCCIGNTAQYA